MHVATISCQKLYQDFGFHFSMLSGLFIDLIHWFTLMLKTMTSVDLIQCVFFLLISHYNEFNYLMKN